MWEVVLDAFLDTLKILPILLIANFLIEYFEFKASKKVYHSKFLNGNLSPLFASAVGLIPQCGFSVVAANLYSSKKIAIGTLLAIFITTSDEAIPIMLGGGAKSALQLIPLLVGKFVLAIIVGYIFNFIINRKTKKENASIELKVKNKAVTQEVLVEADKKETCCDDANQKIKEQNKSEHEHSHDEQLAQSCDNAEFGCHHHKIHESKTKALIIHPIIHTLIVSIYIFVATLAFGLLIYFVGADKITNFIGSTNLFAPFLVGLVGLIPNCASSVIIASCLVNGMISFGAAFAGLCANAGIAFVVLFKQNKNIKENFAILGVLYFISTIVGFIIDLIF